jgi:hypothetical protein
MAQKKYYFNLQEAEELKQTFLSWINKVAHIGNGQISILKEIIIKPRKSMFRQAPEHQLYHVEFQFINSKTIDASHFLISNRLTNMFRKKSPLQVAFKNPDTRDFGAKGM